MWQRRKEPACVTPNSMPCAPCCLCSLQPSPGGSVGSEHPRDLWHQSSAVGSALALPGSAAPSPARLGEHSWPPWRGDMCVPRCWGVVAAVSPCCSPGCRLCPRCSLVLSLLLVKVSVVLLVLQGRAQGCSQLLWPQPGAQPLGVTSVGRGLGDPCGSSVQIPTLRMALPCRGGHWWVLMGVPRVLGCSVPRVDPHPSSLQPQTLTKRYSELLP